MPQITTSIADHLDAQREIIRQSLDQISNDIGMDLRDAGLTFPIFITVPYSGDALATLATPLDPPEPDWSHALEIACRVIQQTILSGKLRSRALVCTAINTSIASADVTAE